MIFIDIAFVRAVAEIFNFLGSQRHCNLQPEPWQEYQVLSNTYIHLQIHLTITNHTPLGSSMQQWRFDITPQ
ncbi:hypothetical protein D3C76_1543810 [compost metagenome]